MHTENVQTPSTVFDLDSETLDALDKDYFTQIFLNESFVNYQKSFKFEKCIECSKGFFNLNLQNGRCKYSCSKYYLGIY